MGGKGDERSMFDAERDEPFLTEKKGRRRLAMGLCVGLLLAAGIAGMAFLPCIKNFQIRGTTGLDIQEVMEESGLASGQHILTIDRAAVAAKIEEDPYYIVQDILYHFPNTLEIVVEERNQDACIRYLDKDIVISSDGTVLEVGNNSAFPNVLRLQGISVTGYAVGERIGVQDDFQLSMANKALEILHDTGYVVDYDLIDLSTPVDLKLLSKNRITVRIGQLENMEEKLFKAANLLRKLANEEYYGGVIDATTDRLTYRNSPVGGIEIPEELLGSGGDSGGGYESGIPAEIDDALLSGYEGTQSESNSSREERESRSGEGSESNRNDASSSSSGEASGGGAVDLPEGLPSDGVETNADAWEDDGDMLDEVVEEESAESADGILPGLAEEGE